MWQRCTLDKLKFCQQHTMLSKYHNRVHWYYYQNYVHIIIFFVKNKHRWQVRKIVGNKKATIKRAWQEVWMCPWKKTPETLSSTNKFMTSCVFHTQIHLILIQILFLRKRTLCCGSNVWKPVKNTYLCVKGWDEKLLSHNKNLKSMVWMTCYL